MEPRRESRREPRREPPSEPDHVRTIDCGECVMARTPACDDCVVTFVVERDPGDALVIDAEAERALRALGDGGLVPVLRHRRRVS